jgi:hypothetical protein
LIGQVLGVRPARITFDKGANARFRFEVDGAVSTEMEPIEGQGGGTIEIKGHPLAVSPGQPLTVSRASHLKINDHEIACDIAGRNGFFAPFAYQG